MGASSSQALDPYRILEDLGEVPFGRGVWAVDTQAATPVIVLWVDPSRLPAGERDRLVAEARALTRLVQPGLPVVYEVRPEGEELRIVVEPPAEGEAAAGEGETGEQRMLPEDADLALARKLMESDSRVLFGSGSEEDTRLLADIKEDIAGLDFEDDPEGLELARTLFGESPLLCRASRTGAKRYNRRLSEQRVAAVHGALQGRGIPGEQVHGFGLGYEPPQITEEIARAYDLDPGLTSEQRNRSVLVVAHLPGPDSGGTRTAAVPGR